MLYLLAELVAVILFIVRILPTSLRTSWGAASAERHLAAASIWIVVALGLFMYLVVLLIGAQGDINAVPAGMLIASDHATYIGVITNTTFAILTTLLAGAAGSTAIRQVVFWGLNLGLLVFVIGLVTSVEALKMIGAPVMGASLLIGLAVFAMGLLATRPDPAPDALTGATPA
jgi:hypothetical protein